MSLISTSAAVINNLVTGNHAKDDGGGVHVCTTCYPHANPFLYDNDVVDNTSAEKDPTRGAAGVGAAYLRAMSRNNIHGNLRDGVASDFGWFHELKEGYSPWVSNPSIAGNWWGTTDEAEIADTVFDGQDDPQFGVVSTSPPLQQPSKGSLSRVVITSRKIRYPDAGEPMPVFLTVYNPGSSADLDLLILLRYGSAATLVYDGAIDFPNMEHGNGVRRLTMPDNGVFFTQLIAPERPTAADVGTGAWYAALFDTATGQRIGDVCEARFELDEGQNLEPTEVVLGGGVTDGSATVVVGDTSVALEDAFGVPTRTLDLGDVGVWFDYQTRGIAGLLTGPTPEDTIAAIYVGEGFAGDVHGGVRIGTTSAEVESALGPSGADPFLQSSWYRDRGLALEMSEGAVTRIHVF